jgi:HK97 family phage major capsid protein
MPYNNLISRTSAAALVPEQVSNDILTGLINESAALTMFRQIRMSTNQTRMPVLAALPTAYFVNGDTGLKQTTQVDWSNKYINVEELAAIVPIPEAVLDDVNFDVWGSIRPLMEQAIARALDAAIFFGVNKPASWPAALVADAVTAGNTVNRGTATQANGGLASDLSDAFATIEADGFDVNGIVANTRYKGLLRNVRATDGRQLLDDAGQVYGTLVRYPMRGLWPAVTTTGQRNVEMVLGDYTQGILATRQDITYKLLDQAVIQDGGGAIQYNLAQQDMVAMRVVARFGFQLANTLNYDNPTATRYPFAVVQSPTNP